MTMIDTRDIDHARLRADRRARVLAQMDAHDLDVLVLGREANARFASGARRLWTAGTRPFAPSTVVVRATGDVHVLSTWDAGMPPEIDRSHLYGMTWNPATLTAEVGAIPGVGDARRVGVDGMTARAAAILAAVAPYAEVVDGVAPMLAARRCKSVDEIACIAHAVAVAEAGVAAAFGAMAPGVRERDLAGRYLARMAELAVTTPLHEGAVDGRIATDRPVDAGDVVAFDGGAVYEGYAGVVGRTRVCPAARTGTPAAAAGVDGARDRWSAGWAALAAALHPGATGADVAAAWSGGASPTALAVRGIGLGLEPTVAADDVLDEGMVLSVGGHLSGGWLVRETVRITAAGPELLTRLAL